MHKRAMFDPLLFGAQLLTTLVALILIPSWKVDSFHMHQRTTPDFTDLATQFALELSFVFSLSEFATVSTQVLFKSSIFVSGLHLIILHLQCSQALHE